MDKFSHNSCDRRHYPDRCQLRITAWMAECPSGLTHMPPPPPRSSCRLARERALRSTFSHLLINRLRIMITVLLLFLEPFFAWLLINPNSFRRILRHVKNQYPVLYKLFWEIRLLKNVRSHSAGLPELISSLVAFVWGFRGISWTYLEIY